MRAFRISLLVWLGLIVAGAALGAVASLGTGAAPDLPKWNGWSYVAFCAQEGARLAVVLTWPIALIVFIVALASARRRAA